MRVAEPLSPPPPPSADVVVDAAEVFIEAHYAEFAAAYPGPGGMPRTISEAVKAYKADGGGRPVAEWWAEVVASVERYREAVDRKVTKVRDSPFFFMDRLYLKQWAGNWSSRVTSSRFDPASLLEPDAEKERLIRAGTAEPATVKQPAAATPPTPPTPKPPSCRTCGGEGKILREGVRFDDIESGDGWTDCPSCNYIPTPVQYVPKPARSRLPRKTQNDLVPIRAMLSPIN